MPRFGRARHATAKRKAIDLTLGWLYTGGWTAAVTRAIGLQGTLEIAEHTFRIRREHANAPALRVVFASDFHSGPTVHRKLMADVVAAIADSGADVVLLGGDYVSFSAANVRPLAQALSRITPPLGKFGVLGNHDLLGDDQYVTRCLADAGVTMLVNANARLASPHQDVWICGLDDWDDGYPDPDKALAGATGTRILLAHQPDGVALLGDRRFDLGLAGHVHGGQFLGRGREPIVRHKGPLSKLYMRGGVFRMGTHNTPVLVSRGIGTSTLPARWRAEPQVHIITILPT